VGPRAGLDAVAKREKSHHCPKCEILKHCQYKGNDFFHTVRKYKPKRDEEQPETVQLIWSLYSRRIAYIFSGHTWLIYKLAYNMFSLPSIRECLNS
jgi:hypothetical protein